VKVRVTHLKAPWPSGTEPGHVVEIVGASAVPGWAAGKCEPVGDDMPAVSQWPVAVAPAVIAEAAPEQPEGELTVNPAPATGGKRTKASAAAG
jgi:hypothetical protein